MDTIASTSMSSTQPTTNSHLSYPTTSEKPPVIPPPTQVRQLLKDRLYIGNLHPTVDEYTLLQVFSKFGKVTKLDFLFHKTGPCKGKPRGYAFVEYGNDSDALKALGVAHDKLLRGRKLVVTFAHQAPLDHAGASSHGNLSGPGNKYRKGMTEAGRPTTLSMLKSGMGSSRNDGTKDKIAMMEAKLRQMEQSKPLTYSSSSMAPSLPTKPSFTNTNRHRHLMAKGALPAKPKTKTKTPLPSLPIRPPAADSNSTSLSLISQSYAAGPDFESRLERNAIGQHKSTMSGLVGVRIGKPKDRARISVAEKVEET